MKLTFLSAVAGFLTVALGAFGAHGLEGRLSAEAQDWWATATLYGLVHSVAALSLSLHNRHIAPSAAFIIGVFLFSGSLYAMGLGAPRWFGAITPLGGVSFLIGWALIAYQSLRNPR